MTTTRKIIIGYASMLPEGSDMDLTFDQRRLLGHLLRAVASPSIATVGETAALDEQYPPTTAHRTELRRSLHDYLVRTYATPASYDLTLNQWDEVIARAFTILHSF